MLLGLAAIVVGIIARRRVKRGEATGGGMALTGLITGAIALVLGIAIVAGAAAFLSTDTGKCVRDANGDQKKIEECAQNFGK
jgi:hypothetical protein